MLGPALAFKPNVVLIHLATNDLNRYPAPSNEPFDQTPARLGGLIDDVLKQLPDAVVFVAKIIQTKNSGTQGRINTYNAALPAIVKQRADKGSRVLLVDQSVIGTNELSDALHP